MKNSFKGLWQEATAGKLARYIPLLLLTILVLAIPLTVYIAGKQQQLQQHAAGTFTCKLTPNAVAFVKTNADMTGGGCNGSNYCVVYGVTYTSSPPQPVNQLWDFGDGNKGTNLSTQATYHGYKFPTGGITQSSYTVSLQPTASNGISGQTCSTTIKVLPNPTPTVAPVYPTNISFSINPTSVDVDKIDSQPQISLNNLTNASNSSVKTGYRVFIYLKKNASDTGPQSGQGAPIAYNANSPTAGTIAYLDASPTFNRQFFTTPVTVGTYYVLVNAYNGNYVCDWSGHVYNLGVSPTPIAGQTCSNMNKNVTFTVNAAGSGTQTGANTTVEVDSVTPDNTSPNPGDTVNVAVSGKAARMWVYLFKSSSGNPPDSTGITANPAKINTVQTYDPTSVSADTFYKVGTFAGNSGSIAVPMPSAAGTYYFAANAHSDGTTTSPPWAQADIVCGWSGYVFKYDYSSGKPTNVIWNGQTCTNTVGGPVTIGTGGGTVTVGPSENPSNAPSGNPSTNPSENPTATTVPGTPTPTPVTPLSFIVYLDGIGSAGDNANPDNSSLSNKNPGHPDRTLTVTLFDTSNAQVAQTQGTVSYDAGNGDFTGTAGFDASVPSGSYIVKVKTDQYLTRRLEGIQTITSNQTNTMPSATLVAGDANNDDVLNALDYNMILDCYSDTLPAPSCSDPEKQQMADLNDDGVVNQTDYNLFIRELSVKNGD